ncbi:MAG TPA: hypothetical protein VIA62_21210 [Thermoanaerobaculia bacterium]|nr:hypothetical protein [Thermoanaerobaculia bacterium]
MLVAVQEVGLRQAVLKATRHLEVAAGRKQRGQGRKEAGFDEHALAAGDQELRRATQRVVRLVQLVGHAVGVAKLAPGAAAEVGQIPGVSLSKPGRGAAMKRATTRVMTAQGIRFR